MSIDQIKEEWAMWNCNGWKARNLKTNEIRRAGTYVALLRKLGWQEG